MYLLGPLPRELRSTELATVRRRDLDRRRPDGVVLWLPLLHAHGGDPALRWKPVRLVARRALDRAERRGRRARACTPPRLAKRAALPLPGRVDVRLSEGPPLRIAAPTAETPGSFFQCRAWRCARARMGRRY